MMIERWRLFIWSEIAQDTLAWVGTMDKSISGKLYDMCTILYDRLVMRDDTLMHDRTGDPTTFL